MNRLLLAVSLCLALAALLAQAAPTGLAGHYYLERGPLEVGSELLLKEGGRFEWMLTYGAQDLAAGGTWRADGKQVVLTAAPAPEPVFRTLADDEWFDVAPARAQARLAGFALTNPEAQMTPPFTAVRLRIEADGLAVDGDLGGLRGTYVKH